jgi:hypothetical protein
VRTWIIAVGLCLFLFILPLQCFIIGDNNGFGIQGAVLRWQITSQGESLIPIPGELSYVIQGTYTGKTAFMVIFWTLGTIVLTLITIISLIYWNELPRKFFWLIIFGLSGSGLLYLASCIAQYGLLFHGPAGVSFPVGVPVLFIFIVFLYTYQNFLFSEEDTHLKECQ